jgi:hypothetical protein
MEDHNVIQKTNYTHDAMIDVIIANPAINQSDLAKHFGYTPGWISRIIRSDSFREALAARKDEIVDPAVLQSVEKRFEALVIQSLEVLQDKLAANPTPDLALKAADLGARALGYGAKPAGGGVQINQQFLVHTPTKAPDAATWLEQRTTVTTPLIS